MLFSPSPLFAPSVSAFAVNSHFRMDSIQGTAAATHTTGTVSIPAAAKGAVLCLVEVDGTGGTLTGVADNVRIDNASGAPFTHRANLYVGGVDHVSSFWTLNDIPTGSHSIYVDHKGAEVGMNVQMVLVLFDTNITFQAAGFSGVTLDTSLSVADSVTLSGLTTANKIFVGFPGQDHGEKATNIAEETTTDYTRLITGWSSTGDNTTWDFATSSTSQADETAASVFHRISTGGVSSETFTARYTTSVSKNRRLTTGLMAVTEAT